MLSLVKLNSPALNGTRSIIVSRGMCPVTGKKAYALYDGDFPIVPATIYLRNLLENDGLADNTVEYNAYALKTFFTFMQESSLSFWELTPGHIKFFKRFLLNLNDESRKQRVRRTTIQQSLTAVKGLVQYWRGLQDNDLFFSDPAAEVDGIRYRKRRHGMLMHTSWYTRVPSKTWRVIIPIAERQNQYRYKGLAHEDAVAVMRELNREDYHTELQKMLYYRDRGLWGFMLMSGTRKGELVRTHWDDIDQHAGIIKIVDRPEDAWLGELKTGPGEIYVTSTNPLWAYLNEWLLYGRPIAEQMLKEIGHPDHGMLFCNQNGGALTQAAVNHLFLRLKTACNFPRHKFFSPHVTRHTIATLMLNNGVDLVEVQKLLRHRCNQSTQIYAQVSDEKLRTSLENFWKIYGESI